MPPSAGIDRRLAVIESMQAREQVRAQRYDAVGKGAHGTDFMRSTDDRIDYERRSGAELSELRREVERGRELCAGVRSANPGKRWGDVLELRYCEDRTLQEIAGTLGVSVRSVNSDLCSALDWTDMVGLAAADRVLAALQSEPHISLTLPVGSAPAGFSLSVGCTRLHTIARDCLRLHVIAYSCTRLHTIAHRCTLRLGYN